MNIIDVIKSEFAGDVMGKLGSLIGESEDKTKSAVEAAVPGLLALLASLASTSGGADKVVNGLKQIDPGAQGGFGDILAGPQSKQAQEKGGSLLNILFGAGALPVIISILSKFVAMNPEVVKKLLSTLAPLILGTIAKQMSGKSLTSQVLSSFFAEQKSNITAALPPGLSLANIPGLSAGTSGVAAPAPAEAGMPGWLLPLVGLGLLGALAWYFMSGPNPGEDKQAGPGPAPVVRKEVPKVEVSLPDPTKVSADLGGIYTSLTKLLGDVKDAPTADAALPKISELAPKLDGLKALWDKLPDAGKATIAKVTADHLTQLKELMNKVLAIAGVSDKFKTTVNGLITTLGAFTTK
jgi:Bacterial protein of unknown function (DUF937)